MPNDLGIYTIWSMIGKKGVHICELILLNFHTYGLTITIYGILRLK